MFFFFEDPPWRPIVGLKYVVELAWTVLTRLDARGGDGASVQLGCGSAAQGGKRRQGRGEEGKGVST